MLKVRTPSRLMRPQRTDGRRSNLVGLTKKRTYTRGRALCPASFSLAAQVDPRGCAWPSRRSGSKPASSKAVQGAALQNVAVRSGAPSLSHLRLARGSKRACRPWPRGARILPSFNFLKKMQKGLSRTGFPGSLTPAEARKNLPRGDDCPLAGLFFVLKTDATVNREVVFLAGSPPASWHFINQ